MAKFSEREKDQAARIVVMRRALRGIDTYAWSAVHLEDAARKELQKRIDACRAALKPNN